MARGVSAAVAELVDLARVGEFTLPAKLTESFNASVAIQQLSIGTLDVFDVNRAADQINEYARRAEPIDLLELGRGIQAGNQQSAGVQAAQQAQRTASERAGDELATVAYSLTEEVIVEHLRPVFVQILEEAREPAKEVHEHPVSPIDLRLRDTNEVRSVRAALRRLEPLAQRRAAIVQARSRANMLGARRPERDHENMFATLRTPEALVVGWQPHTRFAHPAIPQDSTEALVWYLTDGAPGQPWLPTVQQQDEIWMTHYGEMLAQQKAAANAWPRVIASG
jgi:hypothetical protein